MRPNILLILLDQWRADWTAMNSSLPIRTPSFVSLCEQGVRFSHTITPSPLCGPARAALASGREYDQCGVPDNKHDYPIDQPTFYALLRDAGYHVMGCGKFDLAKATFGWKLDGSSRLQEWGFSEGIDCEGKSSAVLSGLDAPAGPYMAFLESLGLRQIFVEDMRRRAKEQPYCTWPTPLPEETYADNWVAAHALRLISGAPRNKPWFLQINFLGPHLPWDVTVRMFGLYKDEKFPVPAGVPTEHVDDHQAVRRNYAAMIENIDRWVGVILEALKETDELTNSLIIMTADHGEMLGERGHWGKGVPFEPSVAVPLVIAGPGVRPGATVSTPTTILDLPATLADFAEVPQHPAWDSRSLRRQLESPTATPPRTYVFSGMPHWRLVFDGRYKLVASRKGATLLDLEADPGETLDFAKSNRRTVERLWPLLRERGVPPL